MQLERLREWRESRGLTQKELARKAGVGEVTVARVETGASIRPNTARKIANALGLTVSDLLAQPPTLAESAPPKAEAPSPPPEISEEGAALSKMRQSEMRQSALAVLYRAIAEKAQSIEEQLKVGRLEEVDELANVYKASAYLATLRGRRDITGSEPEELAEAVDDLEIAERSIQAMLQQELFDKKFLSEEQRAAVKRFRHRWDPTPDDSSTAYGEADVS